MIALYESADYNSPLRIAVLKYFILHSLHGCWRFVTDQRSVERSGADSEVYVNG